MDELSEQHFEMKNILKKNYGRIPLRIKRGFKHAARSAKELRWIVISSTLIVPNKRSCNYKLANKKPFDFKVMTNRKQICMTSLLVFCKKREDNYIRQKQLSS